MYQNVTIHIIILLISEGGCHSINHLYIFGILCASGGMVLIYFTFTCIFARICDSFLMVILTFYFLSFGCCLVWEYFT